MLQAKLTEWRTHLRQRNEILRTEHECDLKHGLREQFHYGKHLIKRYEQYFKFNPESTDFKKKDDVKSTSHRNKGNDFHNQGQYWDAILAYNKSLCFAASAENIGTVYSNRSATYFEMGRFADCHENITLAKQVGNLSHFVMAKLRNREQKCADKDNPSKMDFDQNRDLITILSFDANPRIPFISNRIGIKKEGTKNFLYAKEYIEPGTLIIKEEIINAILLPPAKYTNCCYCLKQSYNLIPCPNCTCAMFCNEECMKRGNEEFHKWECLAIDLLHFFDDNQLTRFSFRLLLKMLTVFGDYAGFEKYWKKIAKKQSFWYSFVPEKYDKMTHFRVFHSLPYNSARDKKLFLAVIVTSAFITREIMKQCPTLNEIFKSEQQKDLFREILLHNMFAFLEAKSIKKDKDAACNELSSTAFLSVVREYKTFEEPNTLRKYCPDNYLYTISTCPILKGEYLTYSPRNIEFLYNDESQANVAPPLIAELQHRLHLQFLLTNFL